MPFNVKILLPAIVIASASFLHASVVEYTNQGTFNSQGTIAFDTTFSCNSTFCTPGDPYTVGGVTYTSGSNIIVDPSSSYAPVADLIAFDQWTPLTGTTDPFNMFGFELGTINAGATSSLMDVQIDTNLATYSFNGLSNPAASSGLQFYGFIAGPGEDVTGFTISSESGTGWAPGITDVELGNAGSVVPEPDTLVTLGSGLVLLGSLIRRRLKA